MATRLRLGLTAVTALIVLASPDARAASPTVVGSCAGPRESSASGPGSYRFAQTFIPTVSGTLTSAEVDVTKVPGSSGDWVVQVVETEVIPVSSPRPAGEPSEEVIASQRIPDSSVPDGGSTLRVEFTDPATLAAGSPRREYKLVITRPSAADLSVGIREGSDCPGALLVSSSQTAPFFPFGDGFGDMVYEAVVSDNVRPRTRIVRGPKHRTTRRWARFKLRASEPVARFECELDATPLKRCDSPKRVRVKPGRHRFKARAIDLAGNVDATPAKFRWKVFQ